MTGRTLTIVALAGLAAGCQGPNPLTARHTTMGSLKTSVSQLEFRNEQLTKQVADLKSENRRFEDRLVQEEAENGDLAARLDDARNLLGDRGGEIRTGSRSRADAGDDPVDEPAPKVRRSNGTRRKPPAASIPGRIEPAVDPDGPEVGLTLPRRSRVIARKPRDDRWLPIAQGLGAEPSAVK